MITNLEDLNFVFTISSIAISIFFFKKILNSGYIMSVIRKLLHIHKYKNRLELNRFFAKSKNYKLFFEVLKVPKNFAGTMTYRIISLKYHHSNLSACWDIRHWSTWRSLLAPPSGKNSFSSALDLLSLCYKYIIILKI